MDSNHNGAVIGILICGPAFVGGALEACVVGDVDKPGSGKREQRIRELIAYWKRRLGLKRIRVITARREYLDWCRRAGVKPCELWGGCYHPGRHVVWANPDAVVDFEPLLVHEFLHALDGAQGKPMRANREIDPQVPRLCGKQVAFIEREVKPRPYRWRYYCPVCGESWLYKRIVRGRRWHRTCGGDRGWSPRTALRWRCLHRPIPSGSN